MENKISLLKNNDNRSITDVEWIQELFDFLQGEVPDGIYFKRGHIPKLSRKKAFSVIYYLQEHLPVFPDYIELCWNCERLFDTEEEGIYWETKDRFYCGNCWHLVPKNYDRGKR